MSRLHAGDPSHLAADYTLDKEGCINYGVPVHAPNALTNHAALLPGICLSLTAQLSCGTSAGHCDQAT